MRSYILIFICLNYLHAAGIAMPIQSAKGLGMAGAQTAASDNPAAMYENPAAHPVDAEGRIPLYVGMTLLSPEYTYEGANGSIKTESKIVTPAFAYAYWKHGDNWSSGLGVYMPYAGGSEWDSNWEGRYLSTQVEFFNVAINPGVAYHNNKFHAGLGIRYMQTSGLMEKKTDAGLLVAASVGFASPALNAGIANSANDTSFRLKGDGDTWGFNLGFLYEVSDTWNIGLNYMSDAEAVMEGTATFQHVAALDAALSPLMPASQDGTATMHLPWHLTLGSSYQATAKWCINTDLQFIGWNKYTDITVDFSQNLPSNNLVLAKNWKNTMALRIGAEYKHSESLSYLIGALYDESPVPDDTFDPSLADNDRIGISVGLQKKWERSYFDMGVNYTIIQKRDKNSYLGHPDMNSDGVLDSADAAIYNALPGVTEPYPIVNGTYSGQALLFSIGWGINL
ncbi:MAG: outer membrane protein transport protein [Planctomycetes bacterium]|nr:outer membrane protein transport protein [Planctomycetota bacterium]